MARGFSVPARERHLADRLVQALLPLIEERLAHKFAAFEQSINEQVQAGEKRRGPRFEVFSDLYYPHSQSGTLCSGLWYTFAPHWYK